MLLEEFNNIESNNSVYDVTNTTDHHKYLIYKGVARLPAELKHINKRRKRN